MIICHLVELTYPAATIEIAPSKNSQSFLKGWLPGLEFNGLKTFSFNYLPSFRDTQREYSSKLLKHSIGINFKIM